MYRARIFSTCWWPHSLWFDRTVYERSFKAYWTARVWVWFMGKVADWVVVPDTEDGDFGVEWSIKKELP